MTGAEFKTKATEVVETCRKYGFMDRTVSPYGFRMTVAELVKNWNDYDVCTRCSQDTLKAELTGFLPILEHWVKVEEEPMVCVMITDGVHTGETRKYHESTAKLFVEAGMAVFA